MIVYFEKTYLKELFEKGQTSDKHHRFQPEIVKKYTSVIRLMIAVKDVQVLSRYGGLHYEHLIGDKKGVSSVRVNNQYRIEFTEDIAEGETVASICNIVELNNHYN